MRRLENMGEGTKLNLKIWVVLLGYSVWGLTEMLE